MDSIDLESSIPALPGFLYAWSGQHLEETLAGRAWIVEGYENNKKVYETVLPMLSEPEVIALLQRLQSRHLNADEIVSSSMRKNSKGYASHLEINKNQGGKYSLMTTGTGHWYTATIRDA
jgi:hypothetical protein